jgi:hypothetical protein
MRKVAKETSFSSPVGQKGDRTVTIGDGLGTARRTGTADDGVYRRVLPGGVTAKPQDGYQCRLKIDPCHPAIRGRFYVLSGHWRNCFEMSEELSGGVALEAPPALADPSAFAHPTHVGSGGRVLTRADHDDRAERPVELAGEQIDQSRRRPHRVVVGAGSGLTIST